MLAQRAKHRGSMDNRATSWKRPIIYADAVDRTLTGRLANAWHSCAPWVFAREMLSQPAAVGAIWPSSGRLARSVASRVPIHGDGLVVELGGGTGAVTHALLQRGIAPGRLVVIERSSAFVRHLRVRFPGTIVVQGDAAELGELLPRVAASTPSCPACRCVHCPHRKRSSRGAMAGAHCRGWHCGPVYL